MKHTLFALFLCLAAPLMGQTKTDKPLPKGTRLVWVTHYGKKAHGRRTSSGERHDANDYVCAHLSLPLGTKIRLRNPKNEKELTVRVNDRGPYSKKYALDISYAAACSLDIARQGVAKLEMTVLEKP